MFYLVNLWFPNQAVVNLACYISAPCCPTSDPLIQSPEGKTGVLLAISPLPFLMVSHIWVPLPWASWGSLLASSRHLISGPSSSTRSWMYVFGLWYLHLSPCNPLTNEAMLKNCHSSYRNKQVIPLHQDVCVLVKLLKSLLCVPASS